MGAETFNETGSWIHFNYSAGFGSWQQPLVRSIDASRTGLARVRHPERHHGKPYCQCGQYDHIDPL